MIYTCHESNNIRKASGQRNRRSPPETGNSIHITILDADATNWNSVIAGYSAVVRSFKIDLVRSYGAKAHSQRHELPNSRYSSVVRHCTAGGCNMIHSPGRRRPNQRDNAIQRHTPPLHISLPQQAVMHHHVLHFLI